MNFKEYFSNQNPESMKILGNPEISENLRYHIDNGISLCENVFRIYSKSYFDLIKEVRELYYKDLIEVNYDDAGLLETDIGETAIVNGKTVYLDVPIECIEKINESEEKKVKLNKPVRTPGGPKKFKVYVKSPSGRVKTVRFGDSKKSGLTIKNANPARAKSFRARHKCSQKHDRTKAGYWSCNVARYAKSLGLKSSRPW